MGGSRYHARQRLVVLTEAAAVVGLSVLLGMMRLVQLPTGGSVTLAALPVLALAITRGPKVGIATGACAGLAHALSGGTIIHPLQLLLDYPIAYGALGMAGTGMGARRSRLTWWRMALGITIAMAAHLACLVLSGVVFFSTVAGAAALSYSVAYNALNVIPEYVIAVVLTPRIVHAVARADPRTSWRRGLIPLPPATRRAPRRIVPTGTTEEPRLDPAPLHPSITPGIEGALFRPLQLRRRGSPPSAS